MPRRGTKTIDNIDGILYTMATLARRMGMDKTVSAVILKKFHGLSRRKFE